MDRKLVITIHMYLSAFFAPSVLLVAISGGLYLVGIKGHVEQETVYTSDTTMNSKSASLKAEVASLLNTAGISDFSFEYVKIKDSTLYTRPTSTEHFIIKLSANGTELIRARPNLQSSMVELHKGHGPSAFKTFQRAFALALIIIILSGLWLGMSAARLRRSTLLTATTGALVFALLLF